MACLFTLVDHPAVLPATIDVLLAEPRATLLRVPRYHGRRGHPIWVLARPHPRVFGRSPKTALRATWWPATPLKRNSSTSNDLGILADIDDPEAYRSLIGGAREDPARPRF